MRPGLSHKLNWKRLDSFHLRCQRRILHISWYDFVFSDEVLRRSSLFDFSYVVRKQRLGLFDHVARLRSNAPTNQILRICIKTRDGDRPLQEWRHASGRPPTTWIHQICRVTGVTATEALELAEDKAFWRTIATAGRFGWSLRVWWWRWEKHRKCRFPANKTAKNFLIHSAAVYGYAVWKSQWGVKRTNLTDRRVLCEVTENSMHASILDPRWVLQFQWRTACKQQAKLSPQNAQRGASIARRHGTKYKACLQDSRRMDRWLADVAGGAWLSDRKVNVFGRLALSNRRDGARIEIIDCRCVTYLLDRPLNQHVRRQQSDVYTDVHLSDSGWSCVSRSLARWSAASFVQISS